VPRKEVEQLEEVQYRSKLLEAE